MKKSRENLLLEPRKANIQIHNMEKYSINSKKQDKNEIQSRGGSAHPFSGNPMYFK